MLLRICITHNDQFSFDQPAIKKNRKKLEQVSLSLSLFFVIVTHKLIDSIPDPITDLDHVDKFGGDTEKVNFVKANRNRRNGVTRSVTHSSRFFDTRVPSHDIRGCLLIRLAFYSNRVIVHESYENEVVHTLPWFQSGGPLPLSRFSAGGLERGSRENERINIISPILQFRKES